MIIDRDALKNDLKTNIIEITFNKVDGTTRTMRATLQPRLLPPLPELTEEQQANKKVKKQNPDVLPVYDVEANGWRSIRYDSIIFVQDPAIGY